MERKIILNLAMSLDGYIASEDGGFDWIIGDGNEKLDTENKWDFQKFLDDIDVVVMGKSCYDQGFYKDFKDKKVYVATSKDLEDFDNIHFTNNIVKEVLEEKETKGKNIFLFGGGILVDKFIKEDIIDEYVVGIIPTILGNGRKLFYENNPKIDLTMEEYAVDKGVIIMRYKKR